MTARFTYLAFTAALILPLSACVETGIIPISRTAADNPPLMIGSGGPSSDPLSEQISGMTVEYFAPLTGGGECRGPMTYRADGTFTQNLPCTNGVTLDEQGRWSIRGDRHCASFVMADGRMTREFCDPVRITETHVVMGTPPGALEYRILSRG